MSDRIYIIDFLRGFTIIHMIIYHTLYDLKYVFAVNMPFFSMNSWYFYQQYICISFIFLSGFSTNFSKKLLRNAVKLSVISIIITIVTGFVSDELAINFGVIHFLAFSMFAIFLLKKTDKNKLRYEKYKTDENSFENLGKINSIYEKANLPEIKETAKLQLFYHEKKIKKESFSSIKYALINLSVFIFLKSSYFLKSDFYAHIYNFMQKFPLSFVYGFPKDDFYSADYFPIIPWIFLSFTGYFTGKFYKTLNTEKNFKGKAYNYKNKIKYEVNSRAKKKISDFICAMGRHSLPIYVIHQVVIYGLLYIIFDIIR